MRSEEEEVLSGRAVIQAAAHEISLAKAGGYGLKQLQPCRAPTGAEKRVTRKK